MKPPIHHLHLHLHLPLRPSTYSQSLCLPLCYRHLHASKPHAQTTAASSPSPSNSSHILLPDTASKNPPPLSLLPLPNLLRSYLITTLTATPMLLSPSLRLLKRIAYSSSSFLNPDTNPILRYLLKKTLYAHFCGGETPSEVRKTVAGLKEMGFSGVILGYAREVEVRAGEKTGNGMVGIVERKTDGEEIEEVRREVDAWIEGTLETVRLAEKGDQVALKFTGAGSRALDRLAKAMPPDEMLEEAIVKICELGKERQVPLLFDAEQHAVQPGIDAWTLEFQRRYNGTIPGRAVVYGTYQAYKRSTPATLAEHLAVARKEGFTLGVKLVRGAYLGSDPRHLFWNRKEETDQAYNEIAAALMKRRYEGILKPAGVKEFPEVNLVLASHNYATVKKAMDIRQEQMNKGDKRIDMVYGQLMGMADEVCCEILQAGKQRKSTHTPGQAKTENQRAYKYLVWGSVGECLKYLLRRAEENRDAVERTKDSQQALWKEIVRRSKR